MPKFFKSLINNKSEILFGLDLCLLEYKLNSGKLLKIIKQIVYPIKIDFCNCCYYSSNKYKLQVSK